MSGHFVGIPKDEVRFRLPSAILPDWAVCGRADSIQQEDKMFRSVAARSFTIARQLAVPSQVKHAGELT